MAPTDAPSPTPSTTAGPKRARATGGTKRKKPEGSAAPDAPDAKVARFGVGMVKGREEEWVEPGDVRTKVGVVGGEG
jgi:hypothetical protein